MPAQAEAPQSYRCKECGEWFVVTATGAALCPNGHGKVQYGITARDISLAKEAEKAQRRTA